MLYVCSQISTLYFNRSGSSWLKVTPWGLRKALNWVRNQYGDVPIYITENGVSDRNGSLQDDHRIYYYKHYINNVLKGEFLKKMLLYSDKLNWLRAYQSFLCHLYAVFPVEKHQIPILWFYCHDWGIEPAVYHTQGRHAWQLHTRDDI